MSKIVLVLIALFALVATIALTRSESQIDRKAREEAAINTGRIESAPEGTSDGAHARAAAIEAAEIERNIPPLSAGRISRQRNVRLRRNHWQATWTRWQAKPGRSVRGRVSRLHKARRNCARRAATLRPISMHWSTPSSKHRAGSRRIAPVDAVGRYGV